MSLIFKLYRKKRYKTIDRRQIAKFSHRPGTALISGFPAERSPVRRFAVRQTEKVVHARPVKLSQKKPPYGSFFWLKIVKFNKRHKRVPLRGIGKTPDEGFPTRKQSTGLFALPFLRSLSCFRPWGAAPTPANF
jgi:hypothetical protein